MKRAFLFGVLALGLMSVPAVAAEYYGGHRHDSYRDHRYGHDSHRRYDDHRRHDHHQHHKVYRVLYRTNHGDWHVYGSYHSHSYAESTACRLRDRGYRVYVTH